MTTRRRQMAAENPIATDAKLRKLLKRVDAIDSDKAYLTWRKSFLKVYELYLDPDGIANALDADARLVKQLKSLAKCSSKVEKLCDNCNICQEQVTAEGQRALGNLNDEIRQAEVAVNKYCPKTSQEEDEVGYDKFELCAVLVRDGFNAYDSMLSSKDFVTQLRDGRLQGILNQNTLKIMDFYFRSVQSFVDVMADLGLFKLMERCVQVFKGKSRPKPKTKKTNEANLTADGQPAEKLASKHGLGLDTPSMIHAVGQDGSVAQNNQATPPYMSTAKNATAKEDFSPSPEEEEKSEEEDDGGEDGGKIIYFDPKTGSIGLISRDQCIEKSELFVVKDEEGNDVNNGVIEDEDEKQQIIWMLKKLERKQAKEESWIDEMKKEKAKKGKESLKKKSTKQKKVPLETSVDHSRSLGRSPLDEDPVKLKTKTNADDYKKKYDKAMEKAKTMKIVEMKQELRDRRIPADAFRGKQDLMEAYAEAIAGNQGLKKKGSEQPPLRKAPLEETVPKKKVSTAAKNNGVVVDYQGIYKEAADRPEEEGWSKVDVAERKAYIT